MPEYQFRCNSCRRLFATTTPGDTAICTYCAEVGTRRYAFYTASGIKEHWNTAVGQYVSNQREMTEALKRQGEEMSVRTGLDTQYEYVDPADMRDATAHGASEEGLEETRRRQRDLIVP